MTPGESDEVHVITVITEAGYSNVFFDIIGQSRSVKLPSWPSGLCPGLLPLCPRV